MKKINKKIKTIGTSGKEKWSKKTVSLETQLDVVKKKKEPRMMLATKMSVPLDFVSTYQVVHICLLREL